MTYDRGGYLGNHIEGEKLIAQYGLRRAQWWGAHFQISKKGVILVLATARGSVRVNVENYPKEPTSGKKNTVQTPPYPLTMV